MAACPSVSATKEGLFIVYFIHITLNSVHHLQSIIIVIEGDTVTLLLQSHEK